MNIQVVAGWWVQRALRQRLLMAALLVGVLVVPLGIRAPQRVEWSPEGTNAPASVGTPRIVRPLVNALRAAPARSIGNARDAAVVSGVAFGRTEQFDAQTKQDFLRSGLWHLLAASGQNVALVAAGSLGLAWLVGARRIPGALGAGMAVALYVIVAGGGASLDRAALMAELGLLTRASGRLHDTWDAALLAAVVLVWWSPGIYRTLGFELSYACVLSIVLWCKPVAAVFQLRGVPSKLAEGLAATVLCSMATGPILLASRGAAPIAGTLANLVAIPLAGGILVIGLAGACVLLVMPAAGVPLLRVSAIAAHLLANVAHIAAAMPGAQVHSWRVLAAVELTAVCAWCAIRIPGGYAQAP